jgi:filamentous hemagglutinin family protein
LLYFIFAAQPVAAEGPQGGAVAAGVAGISQTALSTTILQSTNRAIIDWRSFNVAPDHTVTFVQPGQDAATLNRVQSFSPSVIAGSISAPGTVVIQNAAGVIFTGDAMIDAGGLVASSQIAAPDAFFERGILQFSGGDLPGARVSNAGRITVAEAGLAALVGRTVENSGLIVAHMGTVALASGETTTIDLAGDGLFHIGVSGDPEGGSVTHSGVIEAPGGRVLMTAGGAAGLLDSVINTSGIVRATSGTAQGGTITLLGRRGGTVRVAGSLAVAGATDGGMLRVTGERVAVAATAVLDAGGNRSGGKIFVGGERQGSGDMRRAENVVLHTGSVIKADGATGAGGEVIIWADATTWFDGAITATGAAQGGFIETSAKGALGSGDTASVSAGAGGTWLLDPRDVVIVNRIGATAVQGVNTPVPGAGDFRIVASTIVAALNRAENVIITTAQPANTDAGDIAVTAALRWNGAGNLTLNADSEITVNAEIRTNGAGNLTLNAASNVEIFRNVQTRGAGDIAITAGGDVILDRTPSSTSAGNVSITSGGSIFVNRAGQVTGAGDMTFDAAADIVVNQRLRSTSTGDITLTAGNDVTLNNSVFASRDGDVTILARSGDITLGGANGSQRISTNRGDLSLEATAGSVLIERTNTVQRDTSVFSNEGDLSVVAGTEILVRSGELARQTARIGRAGDESSVTLTAPTVSVIAGDTVRQAAAQVIGGRGGSLRITATTLNIESGNAGAVASVQGLNRAPLTINAATQTWDGFVRGTGDVTINGAVTASVRPRFALGAGSNFSLNASTPAGSFASANEQLIVRTTGGTIALGAAVEARRVDLRSDTGVTLSSGTTVTATAPRNALVIAAGARFENAAGAGVLQTTDASARWLLYMDNFAALVGTAPTSGTFDLYNRPFASNGPNRLGAFAGNRIIYGEQPDLTLAAVSATKTYGDDRTGAMQFTLSGLRPGDSLTTALNGPVTLASSGAPGAAPVAGSPYAITLAAQASNQGYNVITNGGTLSILPAALNVVASDASRDPGQPNPPFFATIAGFVLGQTVADLGGALTLTTTATLVSPPGPFAITPAGLTSTNYAISFVPGTLTINAPVLSGGLAVDQNNGGVLTQRRALARAAPLTPGDAAFRTTVRDIGLANADPFTLSYSLGQVLTFAPSTAATTAANGFVPAAGGLQNDSEGFEPAAGGLAPEAAPETETAAARDACGVAVNLGANRDAGCVSVTLTETYWERP